MVEVHAVIACVCCSRTCACYEHVSAPNACTCLSQDCKSTSCDCTSAMCTLTTSLCLFWATMHACTRGWSGPVCGSGATEHLCVHAGMTACARRDFFCYICFRSNATHGTVVWTLCTYQHAASSWKTLADTVAGQLCEHTFHV